ncbi:MAG: hypothetical protein ACKOB4_00010 [Acidobacteriota bacterium]
MEAKRGSRHILLNGLAMVLAGLTWGIFIVNTPYPRLALVAHIQFIQSGMLFTLLAVLLIKLDHAVGARSLQVIIAAVWLNWLLLFSDVANAWWGTSQMLPIAGGQAGATGAAAWQEALMKVTHIGPSIVLLIAWALLFLGFVRHRKE